MFAELIKEITDKIDTNKYAEALCMYNMEQQNFRKLMTDVIYTNEDTYPVYIDLATTAFPTITRFVGGKISGRIKHWSKTTNDVCHIRQSRMSTPMIHSKLS